MASCADEWDIAGFIHHERANDVKIMVLLLFRLWGNAVCLCLSMYYLCIIHISTKSQQEGQCNVPTLLMNYFWMHYLLDQHFPPLGHPFSRRITGEILNIITTLSLIVWNNITNTPKICVVRHTTFDWFSDEVWFDNHISTTLKS